jgi:antitoxin component of RelBE/YafQ-DinJ toxin-antitoxin module
MGKKSSGYVKIEVPSEVVQHLREVADEQGQTMGQALLDIINKDREDRKITRPVRSSIPNAETRQAMEEVKSGKNLKRFKNLDDLFKDLGI